MNYEISGEDAAMKSQDILVVLKILSKQIISQKWSQRELASELGISIGEVNASLKRSQKSGFLDSELQPVKYAIKEFLLHGFKYCFPAEMGQPTRGIKTAHAAPFVADNFVSQELPPVWPSPEGEDRGFEFKPLYKSVPFAVKTDPQLYRFLALLDILRSGRKREVNMAKDWLVGEIYQSSELKSA